MAHPACKWGVHPLVVLIIHAFAGAQDDPLKMGVPVPAGAVAIVNGETVGEGEFLDEMAAVHLRPTGDGATVLESLVDALLVNGAMAKRGLSVGEADVDKRIEELDRAYQLRDGGKTLAATLAENKISMDVFRKRMAQVVALEALARSDLSLPAGQAVENLHLRAWLNNARQTADIVLDAEELPQDSVAVVNGTRITKLELVQNLVLGMDPRRIAKTVENLLQAKLVGQLLKARSLTVDDRDIIEEWQYRKDMFSRNPAYQGIRYEEMVTQQTGLSPQAVQASRAFRANAGIGKLARAVFGKTDLMHAYEEHKSRYGPRLQIRHILIAAVDNPFHNNQGVPTLAQGKARAEYVLDELAKGTGFDELARLYSADTATKARGGVLPEFTPGRSTIEPAIVEAALGLEAGEVSKPVQTPHGWHIVRLDRREPAPPLSDPDVEADLRRFLADRLVADAYKAAEIGIHVRLLKDP